MPCYAPLQGFYNASRAANGGRAVTFSRTRGLVDLGSFPVGCGVCVGCRLARSQEWAVRCVHEAQYHARSSFLRLSYSNKYVPAGGTLQKEDVQLFLKRLRDRTGYGRLRYFYSGEYGGRKGRPHYHMILFGEDFSADRYFWQWSATKRPLFRSPFLEEVWPHGHSTIGDVTIRSAAYAARYALKKVGSAVSDYVLPEFNDQSSRPGLGAQWIRDNAEQVLTEGSIFLGGKTHSIPRFYQDYLKKYDPVRFHQLKVLKSVLTEEQRLNSDSFRLPVREKVKLSETGLLYRGV